MEFFIDTANLDEIRKAQAYGLVDGVTTNPSLVAKEGFEFMSGMKQIAELVPGPVSAEVIALDAEGMVREARELVKLGDNIVIKIPMVAEGLKAVKELSEAGIKTNVKLHQRIMAAGDMLTDLALVRAKINVTKNLV